MKRNRLLTVVGLLLVAITAVSSTIEETEFFKENPLIGGDGRITKSKHFVDGSDSCTQFEIEVTEGGNYLVNFWLLSTQLSDGSFCSYRVKVNDAELPNKIVPVKSGWQSIEIDGDIPISLKRGLNVVSVIGTVPDVPLVEYIKIGRTNVSAMIDSSEYDSFLSKIKVESSISVAS